MPEKPPSTPPPEENFAFSHDVYGEEFGTEWTPAVRKRIQELFVEVGWDAAYHDQTRVARLHDAYRIAVQDHASTIASIASRAGFDESRAKDRWESYFRDQMDFAAVAVAHGNAPPFEGLAPKVVGPILLRMKEILGGNA